MSRSVRLLILVAGALVLGALIRRVGLTTILALVRQVGPAFGFIVLLYGIHVAFRAWALHRTLAGTAARFTDVLRIRLAAEAIEMLTFTGPVFAEPAKGFLLTRRGLQTSVAYGAAATEYLLYSLVSACLAVTALSILIARHQLGGALRGGAIAIIVGMSIFIAGCVFAAVTGIGLLGPAIRTATRVLGQKRSQRLSAAVAPVEGFIVTFLHSRPLQLIQVVAIELAGHAVLAGEVWVMLEALGASRSLELALIAEGAVKFIGSVFAFVPGQLGAAEGSYVVVFRALGFPDAVGLTIALVRRLRSVLVAGVCLAIVTLLPPAEE